jgi:aspartyl-tRNA(Asn)/glutamyl-tRNA(Gln) amidotransferase subunit C
MNLEDVKRIAHLSHLSLSEDEAKATLAQLQKVFLLVEQIMAIAQPLREDVVSEHDQRDAYLKNAPAEHEGLFLVPKVIE